ncbi:MAG: BREX-2 system phosphatase PglZ [Ardenticatenia bacterium]|nr:BREX-2 system phosphatase PglZ [Ardenticatenia bacterium]
MSNRALLQRLVELAGGARDRGYILALEPEGLGELPSTLMAGPVRYLVARVGSELGLRRLLGQMGGAAGAPFIALLPEALARRLPPDLLRRARRERVHALESAEILGIALGAPVQGLDHAEQSELAFRHLDALRARLAHGDTLPTFVDGDLLDELLAEVILGRRLRGAGAGAVLAALLQRQSPVDAAEAQLLARLLPRRFGSEGRVLAWAIVQPERLRALVEHGVLLAIDAPELSPAVWGGLRDATRDTAIGLPEAQLRRICAELAESALEALDAGTQGLLLQAAERLGRQSLTPAQLARSRWLPLGLDNRCAELAQQAAAGASVAADAVAALSRHHAHADRAHDIAVVEALARLSRFVAAPHPPLGDNVGAHLQRYRRDGAFGDLAAARLRRVMAASGRFRAEADAVLARWRARREQDNLAFAQLLAKDYVGALHAEGIIPIYKVWQAQVQSRLTKGRRVLVLLLDGCSYPIFLELLEQLADPALAGSGLGLPAPSDFAAAEGLPGMAILPSITSHSRGALWLGQIPKDPLVAELNWGADKEAATDPARFKQNAALGSRPRRLFLKGELQADGGAALRAAVADVGLEVVAAVFNAVDDSIGSSATGLPLDIRADRIAGLLPVLREALVADRDILLLADHGHSLHEGAQLRVAAGSAPRYIEISTADAVPDGFLTIPLGGLGGSKQPQAFAWRMGAYLGSRPQVGYHGGCGLEELAIPMAWLERGGVAADPPGWWVGGAEDATGKTTVSAATAPIGGRGSEAMAIRRPIARPQVEAEPAAAAPALDPLVRQPQPHSVAALARRLPQDVIAALAPDHRQLLERLALYDAATASELADTLERNVSHVRGAVVSIKRFLHLHSSDVIIVEALADGDLQYRWVQQ